MLKTFKILLAFLFVSLVAACGGKKEVTALEQAQAVQAAGEAGRANFINDYAAAEKALTRATTLNPYNADYWFDLGIARVRIKDKSGARSAFKSVISVCNDSAAKDPKNPVWLTKQLRPLIMLGRIDEARALLDKAAKLFPNDPQVRQFKEQKFIDQLLADPQLKDFSV